MDNLPITLAKVYDKVYGQFSIEYTGPEPIPAGKFILCENCLVRNLGPVYFHEYLYDVKGYIGSVRLCDFCHYDWWHRVGGVLNSD